MILFVGSEEKGFFVSESQKEEKVMCLGSNLHIEEQASDILRLKDELKTIIYDVEQYADDTEEVVNWIFKIQSAVPCKIIIFAPGYSPESSLIRALWDQGIKNYIFSFYLGEQKEDLEYCLSGYYENFGYKEKRGFSFEEPEEPEGESREKTKALCIGIAGAIARMGTTTQAVQFVKSLQFLGYRAAYIQMNSHGFAEAVSEFYEEVTMDKEIGRVSYADVDMFYRMDKLQDVLQLDYDYLVFDYGVTGEHGFNKVSFLEKDSQILVVGSKPGGEFEKTYNVIRNNFYNKVHYIFNFTSQGERKDILELMEDKASVTFFAGDCRDPFLFDGDTSIAEKILMVGAKEKAVKEKKSFFGGRRKK